METTNKETSRIAIASIYCALGAILSTILFCLLATFRIDCGHLVLASMLFSAVAFSLGFISIVIITIRHTTLKGYIHAILAITLSIPFIFMTVSSIYVAKFHKEREKANMGTYNLRLLGEEIIAYSKANNACLPVADKWCDLLIKHNSNLTEDNFRHPRADKFDLKGQCHFAFNKNLGGMRLDKIPEHIVLLFEADGDWNLTGTEELLRTRYREKGCITILFFDQTTGNYWFHENAVRKFNPKGTQMYYEELSWNP